MRNALTIVCDGLRAGHLGCYGTSWCMTPVFDQLAAQSCVFDQAFALADGIEAGTALWYPNFHGARVETVSLPRRLESQGTRASLLADNSQLASNACQAGFQHVDTAEGAGQTVDRASDAEADLASGWTAWWQETARLPGPFAAWIHCSSLFAANDSETAIELDGVNEDDLFDPVLLPAPPDISSAATPLPSEQVRVLQENYAEGVEFLDRALGYFLETFLDHPVAESTLLVVVGARGRALGERGIVDPDIPLLHEETLHVPLLLRHPDGAGRLTRHGGLVSPSDLYAALVEWFDVPPLPGQPPEPSLLPWISEKPAPLREHLRLGSLTGQGPRGIRTAQWYLRQSSSLESSSPEPRPTPRHQLYAKPDDRWEINDVSDRCPEVVEELQALLAGGSAPT